MSDKETPKENQLSFDAYAEELLERVSSKTSKTKAHTEAVLEAQEKMRARKACGPRKAPGPVVTVKSELLKTGAGDGGVVKTETLKIEIEGRGAPLESEKAVVAAPILPIEPEQESEKAQRKKEPDVLTVAQLNKQIKGLLEKSYPTVWVKGEISNFKVPGSGHMYFTLKDESSQIPAVMFAGFAKSLKFRPEDGMEVLVRARVTVYEPRGNYQLFCEVMEPVGYGALQVAFEKLKAQLAQEGLFEQARKRLLPAYPERLALITSPTGAAIRDMLNILGRRGGGSLDITLIPTSVQGDKAPGEIVAAIELANRLGGFDVIIVGRGGGSLEDLWAFNTESVVRAVAASKIPTISAVGHEVDFTICDFVADLRAPTPSAAAELVCKNKADLLDRLGLLNRHLAQQMRRQLEFQTQRVRVLNKGLVDPKRRLQDLALRTDELSQRLHLNMLRFIGDSQMHVQLLTRKLPPPTLKIEQGFNRLSSLELRYAAAMHAGLERRKSEFQNTMALMDGLSPLRVLDRGYSIVKKGNEIIKQTAQVRLGDQLSVRVSDGDISCQVISAKN